MISLYEGRRTQDGCIVTVDGVTLDPRLDLRNQSPTGLEWGYGGSGPAQLALALLAHHFGSDSQLALALYQGFKAKVVARLPYQGWQLTTQDMIAALCDEDDDYQHCD